MWHKRALLTLRARTLHSTSLCSVSDWVCENDSSDQQQLSEDSRRLRPRRLDGSERLVGVTTLLFAAAAVWLCSVIEALDDAVVVAVVTRFNREEMEEEAAGAVSIGCDGVLWLMLITFERPLEADLLPSSG